MFKTKNKILPLALTPHAKFKQKIWGISGAIFLLSTLLIDVVNARTGSHTNWILLLFENIPVIILWILAYSKASYYKDFLKIFTPIYLSLVLLIATGFLVFNHLTQQHLEKKFGKEVANIKKDYANFIDDMESSPLNQSLTYSADEYGHFTVCLNKFKKLMELSKQETRAVIYAFDEIELDKVFTDEVLFNFFNISEKKKKLEQLLPFLDESAKRMEDIYSEYVTWVLSSPDIDESARKNFAEAVSRSSEEQKFFRQEPYRIKKTIAQEYIKFLDFLSNAHGSYVRGEDARILFTNDNDLQAWKSHCEILIKLFKEEENFDLLAEDCADRKVITHNKQNKS